MVVDPAIEALFLDWPQNLKEGIRKDFYQNLNASEIEYSQCKELLLKPEDDISSLDKIAYGGVKKSKAMINLLVDNLSEHITGKINMDPIFKIQVIGMVHEILNKKEIDGLVLKASKEIE